MSSIKHRHLGVKSSHRIAMLRNLVTTLVDFETLRTTWPRAKEAQKLAEKLITLGKRNTNAARQRAQGILFRPDELVPKLFGALRKRYVNRPGGYTRVLRIEPLDRDTKHKKDTREYNPGQSESAILELVDGPWDMRFAITARACVRQREIESGEDGEGEEEAHRNKYSRSSANLGMSEALASNVRKVTRFKENGEEALEKEIRRIEKLKRIQKRSESGESGVGRGGEVIDIQPNQQRQSWWTEEEQEEVSAEESEDGAEAEDMDEESYKLPARQWGVPRKGPARHNPSKKRRERQRRGLVKR